MLFWRQKTIMYRTFLSLPSSCFLTVFPPWTPRRSRCGMEIGETPPGNGTFYFLLRLFLEEFFLVFLMDVCWCRFSGGK